jgi:gliding motility-associated-like protein
MKKLLSLLVLFTVFSSEVFSQSTNCQEPDPFCTGSGTTFPAVTGGGTAIQGPAYGCLATQPNPSWFYLKVANSGNLNLQISSTPSLDIDFIAWGPFSSLTGVCPTQLTAQNIVDCSYSSAPIENIDIPNAQTGEFYVVLITNFSQQPNVINFISLPGSTGTTDCSILNPTAGNNGPLCEGQTLNLTSDVGTDALYSWVGPNGFQSNDQNPVISGATVANAGTYTVTITTANETITASTVVVINPIPDPVGFNSNSPVCPGANGVFILTGLPIQGATYTWTQPNGTTSTGQSLTIPGFGDANAGPYSLTVTVNGCTSAPTINNVEVSPTIIPVISGNTHYCFNDSTVLTVTPTFTSYLWSNGATTQSTTLGIGNYTVTGTTLQGCNFTSEPVTVTSSSPNVSITGLAIFCEGECIEIKAVPAFTSYLWSNGSDADTTITCGGLTSVTVTDQFGCQDTASVNLVPVPNPTAAFTSNPSEFTLFNQPVQYTDQSTANNGTIVDWQWMIGDTIISELQNPILVFPDTGSVPVTLVVTNTQGCKDTVTVVIKVGAEVVMPNVFTPGSDGKNDKLVIKNINFYKEAQLTIFNRWGNKIYEATNYDNSWDGGNSPSGTYFYVLSIPEKETKKGTLTIIREN